MSKILTWLISSVVLLQVNSLDVPRLFVLQDLINFSSQLKELIKNTDFADPSLTEENNPTYPITNVISELQNGFTPIDFIDRDITKIFNYLNSIYTMFLYLAEDFTSYSNDTIREFIEVVTVEEPDHVSGMLEKLESEETWDKLLEQLEATENCVDRLTQQMKMFHFYQEVMMTKLESLVAVYGAYNFKHAQLSSDSTSDMDVVEKSFASGAQNFMQQVQELIHNGSRRVFLCDSETHVAGQDYVELEGLFSAIIVNDFEIRKKPSCGHECSAIESTGTNRCIEDRNQVSVCPTHPCKGKIYNCDWIGGDVDVCEANSNSRKRYDWVRSYGNNVWYGQWTQCLDGKYFELRGTYWRWSTCSTCFCDCVEEFPDSRAIRTISLLPQMSNIDENKVVSSVRFVSEADMIHIQIAETSLLPFGRINTNESSWVPLGHIAYDSRIASFNLNNVKLTEDEDYAFVNLNRKTLFMDQITAESGYVLTGVKFSVNNKEDVMGAFKVEIHVTPFDTASGQLIPTEDNPSKWITAETQPNPSEIYSTERREITIGSQAYPPDSEIVQPTVSAPNKYLKFGRTAFTSDGGQSTIPFFDARPIESENSLAFNGLGLVFRQDQDYAGVIGPELFTIDVSMAMDTTINN